MVKLKNKTMAMDIYFTNKLITVLKRISVVLLEVDIWPAKTFSYSNAELRPTLLGRRKAKELFWPSEQTGV